MRRTSGSRPRPDYAVQHAGTTVICEVKEFAGGLGAFEGRNAVGAIGQGSDAPAVPPKHEGGRGPVEPSFATLQEILRACGFQLSTRLEKYVPVDDELRKKLVRAAPSERIQLMLDRRADELRYGR